MLQLTGVSLSVAGRVLIKEADFSIDKGQKCALVGLNGCGKSTLLQAIAGEIEFDTGTIVCPNAYRIGYLRQHEDLQIEQTVLHYVSQISDLDKEVDSWHAQRILAGLGFSQQQIQMPVAQCSGGFKLRLKLARCLLQEPDLLLLDEPTNYLDIASIDWLKQYLRKWNKEVLIICHDRGFLDAVCDATAGVHRQQLTKVPGKSDAYYRYIAESESQHQAQVLAQERYIEKQMSFIQRFRSKATKAKQVQSRIKRLEKLDTLEKLASQWELDFDFTLSEYSPKIPFQAHELSFAYPKQKEIVSGINWEMNQGEHWAIIGPNGVGKSTLLKLLTGKLIPKRGEVNLHEKLHIGYFGQTDIDALKEFSTAYQAIERANGDLNESQIRRLGASMGITQDHIDRSIQTLSGGERARVLLSCVMARACNCLVLDEPTHHLDTASTQALIAAVNRFEGALLVVLHDQWALEQLDLDGLIVLYEGGYAILHGQFKDHEEKIFSLFRSGSSSSEEKSEAITEYAQRRQIQKQIRAVEKKIALMETKIEAAERDKYEKEQSFLCFDELGGREKEQALLDYQNLSSKLELFWEDLEKFHEQLQSLEGKLGGKL